MANRKAKVFLTGSTGFLGHYVLAELLRRPEVSCRLLVRGAHDDASAGLATLLEPLGVDWDRQQSTGRVELITGRLPDQLESSALTGMDQIIHAAASTSFFQRGAEPYRSNVEGTRALLDLASSAGVREFCFVSTAYAGGRRDGEVPECILDTPNPAANDYERSKWLAENAVRDWSYADQIATIVRPSILIGDRRTGRATTFGGIYLLARAVELLARAVSDDPGADRRSVSLRIMGRPDVRPNLVPVCWAARRLVDIALDGNSSKGVHHLVNPAPPSSSEIKRWLEEFFDLGGGEFTDKEWPWPNPSRFEEAFYAVGQSVLDYFLRDLRFQCSESDNSAVSLVPRDHFLRCIDFAQRANWGRAAVTASTCSDLDAAWYFEHYITQNLPRSQVSRISNLTAVVRFVVEGPRGGDWACRYENGRLVETRRRSESVREHFGFSVRQPAFERIVRGQARLQDAYFTGEASIFGDVLRALKLVPVMELFLSEFPVTRAA